MRSIVKGITFAGALCVLAATLQAASGLLIVEKTTVGDKPQIHQIQIESTRMRTESSGANGEKQVMVFDGTKQVLDIIYLDKKTYTEMTKDDVEKMGGQLSDAMAQMQKQMANLPPAQRAQMEAMMKGRMGGAGAAAAPKVQYKKTGTDTVGKWTCDKYEGFDNGQKTSEVCTVDPKVLGFAASDFEISRQLGEFFKKMMPASAGQMFSLGTVADQGFSGVPVRRTFTIGERQVTTEITEVSRQNFPDSSYAVPAGFEKQAFGAMGRGRGRQ
jgi:hypothetical protein